MVYIELDKIVNIYTPILIFINFYNTHFFICVHHKEARHSASEMHVALNLVHVWMVVTKADYSMLITSEIEILLLAGLCYSAFSDTVRTLQLMHSVQE